MILYNSFPLVRYSCPLSTGVLHGLLCPNAYSWCIHGERHTLHPPTPLPSCSSAGIFNVDNLYLVFFFPFVYSLYLRFIEVWLWYTYGWFLYLPSFGVTGFLGSVNSHFSSNLGNLKANISQVISLIYFMNSVLSQTLQFPISDVRTSPLCCASLTQTS